MTITASISDGVFIILGESEAEPGQVVRLEPGDILYDNAPGLLDDGGGTFGGVTFLVPVESDGSIVETIDASGVVGAGVEIISFDDAVACFGSQQDDLFLIDGEGSAAEGLGGDDVMSAGAGRQSLSGGDGDDTILAGFSDDTLSGGAGDDVLNGEDGFDVAVYSGNQADYEITVENGAFVMRDLRNGAPDGVDRIAGVEQLQFADGTLDLPLQPTGLTAVLADRILTLSGEAATGEDGGILPDEAYVYSVPGFLEVRDGGNLAAIIPVVSDGSGVRTIDARAVEGSGVQIQHAAHSLRTFGSDQGDLILAENILGGGDPRGVVLGGAGDDMIYGGGDRLYLGGGFGDDGLFGSEGGDTLVGGKGDDMLDGGGGFDIAVYTGDADDYSFVFENGAYVLTDLRDGSRDGTDVLWNIEALQFADGFLKVPEPPTDLSATLGDRVLTVTGDAASTDGLVFIDAHYEFTTVQDDVDPFVSVAIDGDGSVARSIDARGVLGAGVYVETTILSARVFGSAQDDVIFIDSSGDGVNKAQGGGGNDLISGDSTQDHFAGGAGHDTLFGAGGADTLVGNLGDDVIEGGLGDDLAVYTGSSANHLVEKVYDYYRVTDLRAGHDGVDLIRDVEQLQFSDGVFDIATLVAPPDDALFI